MTYDPERNLLFIHVPKNAGKSIEALLGLVGRDELASYRFRSLPARAGTYLQRTFADRKALQRLFGTVDVTLCAQHCTLQEIELLGLVPRAILAEAFKFAVCRNPWDRAVSTYHHWRDRNREPSRADFDAFWRGWLDRPPRDHNVRAHQRTQVAFVRDSTGRIAMDEILRFEALGDDLHKLARFGVRGADLPRIGTATGRDDYREYYDGELKAFIGRLFEEDVDQFGYAFEERSLARHGGAEQ
ncbi:MAG: sulfotransferase family 2 domain-containing protein [Pirellulales bacterium]|nr:sulfotransferase family 2 domain-containing protein [Pirellulales bacterium]